MSTILVVILTVIFPIDGILKAEAAKKSAKTATYEEYVTGSTLNSMRESVTHSAGTAVACDEMHAYSELHNIRSLYSLGF